MIWWDKLIKEFNYERILTNVKEELHHRIYINNTDMHL